MRFPVLLGAAILAASSAAAAPINLVQNGGFEVATSPVYGARAEFDRLTSFPGWSSSGFNIGLDPCCVDQFGSTTRFGVGFTLWGPNNGSANGLTGSPAGGNFVGLDGAFDGEQDTPTGVPIEQTISGLQSGALYALSFFWAAAQQFGFTGATTEQLQVSFGAQTRSTAVVETPSEGFRGWFSERYVFTASTATQVLSFLAIGTPQGQPPFVLLDGVELYAVPGPAAAALFAVGLFGLFAVRRRG